eukprot:1146684-Pelagomonas_calceolata.AAC.7
MHPAVPSCLCGYMCAANLVKPLPDHVHVMVGFARSIIKIANVTLTPLGTPLSIRVGIHTGPLMSGVIGVHRLKFTLGANSLVLFDRGIGLQLTQPLALMMSFGGPKSWLLVAQKLHRLIRRTGFPSAVSVKQCMKQRVVQEQTCSASVAAMAAVREKRSFFVVVLPSLAAG